MPLEPPTVGSLTGGLVSTRQGKQFNSIVWARRRPSDRGGTHAVYLDRSDAVALGRPTAIPSCCARGRRDGRPGQRDPPAVTARPRSTGRGQRAAARRGRSPGTRLEDPGLPGVVESSRCGTAPGSGHHEPRLRRDAGRRSRRCGGCRRRRTARITVPSPERRPVRRDQVGDAGRALERSPTCASTRPSPGEWRQQPRSSRPSRGPTPRRDVVGSRSSFTGEVHRHARRASPVGPPRAGRAAGS